MIIEIHSERLWKILGEICALLAAFCWALGASLYKKASQNVSSLKFNFARSILAGIFSFLILFILGNWNSLFEMNFFTLIILGCSSILVLVVGDSLYFFGLKRIGVSKTVPICYSYSILVILLSVLILNEKVTSFIVLGTLSIIVGVWLVVKKVLDKPQNRTSSVLGILAGLGTLLCWGFGVVFFKIIINDNDPFVLTAGRMFFLIPTLAILTTISNSRKVSTNNWTKNQLILALVSGLIGLGIGDSLLYLGLDSTNINIVAPLTSTTPIFSTIIAMLFFGEKVSKTIIVGTILVSIGTILLFI